MVKLTIRENEAEQRLDRFLKKFLKRASLSYIYKLIRKDIKLNGKRSREDTMLSAGDELCIYISEERLAELTERDEKKISKKQFKIPYEDDNILIADKPKGLLTHGDMHEKKNTLVNQVCGYLQAEGDYDPAAEKTFMPSPVNRLDRNTTGLVIFGKNAMALRNLTEMIRERDVIEKYYLTIVCGRLQTPMYLDDSLRRDEQRNISEAVKAGSAGKEAFTYVKPLAAGDNFSLVEVRIFTGRTHQIRVHLAGSGFPIIGDSKYGNGTINERLKKSGLTSQLLHAYRIKFNDAPEELSALKGRAVEASLPKEFKRMKKLLIET